MDIILAIVVIVGGIVGLIMLRRRDIKRYNKHEAFNETMENIRCYDQLRCMGLIETAYLFTKYGSKIYMSDKKNLDRWFV